MNCYHCKEKIPAGTSIKSQINGKTEHFCCYGCQGVADVINGADLADYYRFRNRLPNKINSKYSKEHWQAYDLPEIFNQYVFTDDNGCHELHLFLDGIHCSACSWLIKTTLQKKLQIRDVVVNTVTGRAQINWQNQKLSSILHQLTQIGYIPNLFTPDADEKISQKIRNQFLLRIILAGLATMQVMMLATGLYASSAGMTHQFSQFSRYLSAVLITPVLFYSGYPFLKSAFLAIKNRSVNMDIPIVLGAFGAYFASIWHTIIGKGEIYFESAGMFIFALLISRFIEFLTRRKAKLSQYRFAKLLPEAVEKIVDQEKKFIPLPAVKIDDYLYLRPAQTVAVDGIIIEGESRFDEAMLNGESSAIYKKVGDEVLAGSANLSSPVIIKVTKTGQQTTLAGINRLIDRANQKPDYLNQKSEKIASRSISALLILAVIGYLIWQLIDPARAFEIALAVLVATCPCALSLATPTALTSSLNHSQKANILIKSADSLTKLNQINQIVFDKTGTLTKGSYQLQTIKIYPENAINQELAFSLAKSLQKHSSHPIAWYFANYPTKELPITNIIQTSGKGVIGNYLDQKIAIGNWQFIKQNFPKIDLPTIKTQQTDNLVYLANKDFLAVFVLNDSLREKTIETINHLSKNYQLTIASGDKIDNVEYIANKLKIKNFHGKLSAEDKFNLIKNNPEKVLMIGDGINDTPVMKIAGVSVAVNNANPLSQTHADIVLLNNGIEALPFLFNLAKRCKQLIRQNLIWASLYNALIIPLAITGMLTPWIAAIGMSLSSVLVVVNALRIKNINLPN